MAMHSLSVANPQSKLFWTEHFDDETQGVDWEAFLAAMQLAFGTQTWKTISRLKVFVGRITCACIRRVFSL